MVRGFIVLRPFLRPWFGLAGERDWPVRTGFAPFTPPQGRNRWAVTCVSVSNHEAFVFSVSRLGRGVYLGRSFHHHNGESFNDIHHDFG